MNSTVRLLVFLGIFLALTVWFLLLLQIPSHGEDNESTITTITTVIDAAGTTPTSSVNRESPELPSLSETINKQYQQIPNINTNTINNNNNNNNNGNDNNNRINIIPPPLPLPQSNYTTSYMHINLTNTHGLQLYEQLEIHRGHGAYILDHDLKYYSENNQDQKILSLLNNLKKGFFIEIGGYDGETHSVTLNLEREHQWTGLLIEPNPHSYKVLLSKGKYTNNDNNHNSGTI